MKCERHLARFSIAALAASTIIGCGPGEVSDVGSDPFHDLPVEAEAEDGVVGDPWHCGELGLKCVGGLGIGECIDGECQGRLIAECWSPAFAPTCDAFCESFDESCAYTWRATGRRRGAGRAQPPRPTRGAWAAITTPPSR
ncbi:hypothetical protein [Enhygromyxa salina]|uniref:Uncharacterized protein n=1 Tax=Enhygromyxa salina TaxID=215803 RepID=A0A2S9YS85_9BACT|nr:hypothetical protein [Enhygromyxa salina]PRQ07912.1 hypothetical protein ENSA7_23510 [Enhygromyxa salina]